MRWGHGIALAAACGHGPATAPATVLVGNTAAGHGPGEWAAVTRGALFHLRLDDTDGVILSLRVDRVDSTPADRTIELVWFADEADAHAHETIVVTDTTVRFVGPALTFARYATPQQSTDFSKPTVTYRRRDGAVCYRSGPPPEGMELCVDAVRGVVSGYEIGWPTTSPFTAVP